MMTLGQHLLLATDLVQGVLDGEEQRHLLDRIRERVTTQTDAELLTIALASLAASVVGRLPGGQPLFDMQKAQARAEATIDTFRTEIDATLGESERAQ